MGLLDNLNNPDYKATKSDRILIDYIKNNLDNVVYKSISEIAKESGIGEATITRFTRKNGFDGFQNFKLNLAKEISIKKQRSIINFNVSKDESVSITAEKTLKSTIDVLNRTAQSIDNYVISQCRELILTGKKIYLIGIAYSGIVATDSNYKLMRIGLNTCPITDSHTMIMMSSIMERGDVIIAISHSGSTKEILKTVEYAKKNKVKVISLTEDTENDLRAMADFSLTYISNETLFETGSVSSKIPQIFVLDILYTEIIKEMFNEALDRKLKTTNVIESYKDNL